MPNKLTIALLFLIPMLIPACDGWLELVPPDGLVRDEYWQSKEDVEASLMGAYQQFAGLDATLFLAGELRGDLIVSDVNTIPDHRDIMNGNIFPDNSMCNWSGFYEAIRHCNSVLKNAPVVYKFDQTFSEYQLRGFESEALFLRSLAYFYLVRIYRNVPLVLEASESDDVDYFLPESSSEEVLAQVKADLLLARSGVTEDYGTLTENKGRATMQAINALLADVALWNFEYEECLTYINAVENAGFELVPGGQWFDIFYPGNSLESLFEFQFDASLEQYNSTYLLTYFRNNFLVSQTALELLEPSQSKEIIRGDGSLRSQDLKIWKYAGAKADAYTVRSGEQAQSANWIVYRMADLKLMKAEALSQTGRFDEALIIVNDLRAKRLMNPISSSNSASAFEDMILEERARELAFEGKRWFDLLRMGRRNDYQRKDKLIEIIVEKVPSTQKLLLATKLTNPWGWYLPIEADELERNYKLTQNPYYAGYDID